MSRKSRGARLRKANRTDMSGQAMAISQGVANRARMSGSLTAPSLNGDPFTTMEANNPGVPISPTYRHVSPRSWDFQAALNTNIRPRAQDTWTFAQITGVANTNDIVQNYLAARIDQLCALPWDFVSEDKNLKTNPEVMSLIDDLKFWFEKPNKYERQTWDAWLRILLYQVLVPDALTIYPQLNVERGIHSFRIVDGTTIKPLIDDFGMIPQPPYPAYQQIIKGLPRGEYTADEIYYRPMNPQVDSPYGKSPVERCMTTIVTGIRRWAFNLAYYSDGSFPQNFIAVPDNGDQAPTQVKEWIQVLNENLAGDDAARLRLVPLPPGAKPEEVRAPVWSREQDEWIARVIAGAFGMSPLPYVSLMNRSSAEVSEAAQQDLALEPLKAFVASVIEDLCLMAIPVEFQRFRLRFVWTEDKSDVSYEKAQTLALFADQGIMARKQIREEMLGMEPDLDVDELPLGPLPTKRDDLNAQGMPSAPSTPPAAMQENQPEPKPTETVPEVKTPPEMDQAAKAELATWRKYARKHGYEKAINFKTSSIPDEDAAIIRERLRIRKSIDVLKAEATQEVRSEAAIRRAAMAYLEQLKRERGAKLLTEYANRQAAKNA